MDKNKQSENSCFFWKANLMLFLVLLFDVRRPDDNHRISLLFVPLDPNRELGEETKSQGCVYHFVGNERIYAHDLNVVW